MKTDAIKWCINAARLTGSPIPQADKALAELAALEAVTSDHAEWVEREAACCSEDRSFDEVIRWQSKRIAWLKTEREKGILAAQREAVERCAKVVASKAPITVSERLAAEIRALLSDYGGMP